MNGVAFAGSLIVDHLRQIDTLPGRSELAKIRAVGNSTGGCVCNTGMDLAILDPSVPVSAVGVVGDDADGDFVVETLKSRNFDTSRVLRRGTTSFTDVYAESSNGCRTFFQYGGACDTFDVGDIKFSGLSCKIFHIGYLLLLDRLDQPDPEYGTRMARLLSKVQACGAKTSIDVVSENSDRFARIVGPALKYVDYLAFNEIEAGKTTGIELRRADNTLAEGKVYDVLRKLFDMGVSNWAIIHAPEGAWGLSRSGQFIFEPSKQLPKGYKVGSVGAGDAFCAGVLLAAHREVSLAEALVYGNASAQVSLRSASASGSMTTIEEAIAEYRKYKAFAK